MKKHTTIIAFAFLALSSANADRIAWWNFEPLYWHAPEYDNNQHGPDGYDIGGVMSGVQSSGLKRGDEATNHKYQRRGESWGGFDFQDISSDDAVESGRYYYFTLTSELDTIIALTWLEGSLHTSGNGPKFAQWEYSINEADYEEIGDTPIDMNTPGEYDGTFRINLAGLFLAEGDSITFRIVAWLGDSDDGTFYFDGRGAIPELTVFGTVVPEPSTTLLLGVGAAFIAFSRRRRK